MTWDNVEIMHIPVAELPDWGIPQLDSISPEISVYVTAAATTKPQHISHFDARQFERERKAKERAGEMLAGSVLAGVFLFAVGVIIAHLF